MTLSRAVHWWDEWQLRILVLSSLAIQYMLAIFAAGRKFAVPSWYRFVIWLSYLGSDAVAIYALATLFNRQKKQPCDYAHSSRDLEVLWAPVLLMHLGGQVFITAFNIEDNELWRRYIVTAISQVVVAIYVLCKSWSSSADKRLLAVAILLFFLGFVQCLEKSLSLRDASFQKLASHSRPVRRTSTRDREKELEEYVEQVRDLAKANGPRSGNYHSMFDDLCVSLFVDSAFSYDDHITFLRFFFLLDEPTTYLVIKLGLFNIYYILYTKMEQTKRDYKGSLALSGLTWIITLVLSIVAIALFHSSHKKAYNSSDIVVSFVLFYGTFVLYIFSLFVFGLLAGIAQDYSAEVVWQHSLIGFCAGNERFMKHCNSSEDITVSVHEHVLKGWNEFIKDAESYTEFNDIRGHWKLEREGYDERLGWSLEKPFDESILLWHIATDFCLHHMDRPYKCANRSKEISNYMMHLMFANPEMLMAGCRRNLFKTACKQLKDIISDGALLDKQQLTQGLIKKVKSRGNSEETFIHDAWELAQGLMDIGDDAKMWELIQGVWVEMLCFSASRCRGYLHAKSLGSGGEYLSYVWLLLACMGMETFSERLQRTHKFQSSKSKKKNLGNQGEDADASYATHDIDLLKKEENVSGPPLPSQVKKLHREEEAIVNPQSSQGEATASELDEIVVST